MRMENFFRLFAPQVIAGVKSILTSYPSDNAFHFWETKMLQWGMTHPMSVRLLSFLGRFDLTEGTTGVCVGWFKLLIV